MRAIEIIKPGGPEVLTPATRPVPTPDDDEILIKTVAAGINRPDVIQRMGLYPAPPGASDIPGLEISGTIEAVGSAVTNFSIGDEVCALLTGGGYAEYATAPAAQCLPIPEGIAIADAAALPETWFTVWSNLIDRADLQPKETVLIHGGTSGIGLAATMLAKWRGATVITTQSSDDKCAASRQAGADHALNHRTMDFVAAVKERTQKRGANVILDMVGGDYISRNLKCLAVEGRLVQIAFLQGSKTEIDLMPLMLKRQTITGSTLRARPVADKAQIAANLQRYIWPEIATGRISPVIDSRFPLEAAAAAHTRMESSQHIGKILLDINAAP